MKKSVLVIALFAAVILTACKKEIKAPAIPAKPLKEAIIGKWKWTKNASEQFNFANNSWGKLGEPEDYTSRDCYYEFKTDGSGVQHFVKLDNTFTDINYTWSIKDEKNFFFKHDNVAKTSTYTIIKIDEHTLIFSLGEYTDSNTGQKRRAVNYYSK